MAHEFTVFKEFATITATLTEVVAVDRVIKEKIPSAEFRTQYIDLMSDIYNSYKAIVTLLDPVIQITERQSFDDYFDKVRPWFADSFQATHSQVRVNAEFTFEKYLQFRKVKEVNTLFPPLKSAFGRLHDFIDKWIDNDIWLALSLDTVLKILNDEMTQVANMKTKDSDEAFSYYLSCVGGLTAYLAIIKEGVATLEVSLELEQMKKAV